MTAAIFTPKADDKFATATALIEIATIKPSGYIHARGLVTADTLPIAVANLNEYYTSQGRPEPVIYTRNVGDTDWVTEAPETIIPDSLPEGFGE